MVGPVDQVWWAYNKNPIAELSGVGQNLQDHPFLHMVSYTIKDENKRPKPRITPTYATQEQYRLWNQTHEGFFATGSSSGVGLLKTTHSVSEDDSPIEIAISGDMHTKVILNSPASRGEVRLSYEGINRFDDASPFVRLNINDEEVDRCNLFQGARALVDLLETKAFKAIGAGPSDYHHPACKGLKLHSDAYLRCLVKDATVTGFHYAGSCRMGPKDDPMAVVDHRLRVHKTKRLRVVDASVMPTIVRANPNAAVMLIGWKAAKMIKQDNGLL